MSGSSTLDTALGACPRCGFSLAAAAADCARCGVVLAKLARRRGPMLEVEPLAEWRAHALGAKPRPAELAVPHGPALDTRPELQEPVLPQEHVLDVEPGRTDSPSPCLGVDPEGRRALVAGAVIAVVVLALPLARFVFGYLPILVHELGHAATGWLFGYPSVPAFDFTYGGGVTAHEPRRPALVFVIAVAIAWGLSTLRGRPRALAVAGTGAAIYAFLLFSPLHGLLMTAMGHGGELAFAGIFFYRALGGYAVRVPVERPLYAFLAFFIVARDLHFAAGLVTSAEARRAYGDAKGGGHWMDFSQLAHDLGVGLETVALGFFACALAALPLTWFLFRHRDAVAGGLVALWTPTGAKDR